MIEKGNKVKIEYEGSFDDGTVFDSSANHESSFEFTIGNNEVIPGFEEGLMGMNKGEEKKIRILAKDAYGEIRQDLINKVPKTLLPEGMKVEKGMLLGLQAPDGRKIPALIEDVSDTEITINLNHPLAGKNLDFKLKVIEVLNSK